jgi:hypothetical protein
MLFGPIGSLSVKVLPYAWEQYKHYKRFEQTVPHFAAGIP